MNKPSPDKRLTKLASQIPDDEDVWNSINLLMDDTSSWRDHVIATVAGSYVDKSLEVAITAKMVPLTAEELNHLFSFEKKGPLADFGSKIRIAKGLDVFGPDTTQDLDRVRRIRNAFAHTLVPISFETSEVAEVCALFRAPDRLTIMGKWALTDDARGRFVNTTLSIASDLKRGIRDRVLMFDGRAIPARVLP